MNTRKPPVTLKREKPRGLAALRESKGITRRQFARLLGTSDAAIRRWETGAVSPTVSTLKRMAEALDAPPADVFAAILELTT